MPPFHFKHINIKKLRKYLLLNKALSKTNINRIKHKNELVSEADKFYKKYCKPSAINIQSKWRTYLARRQLEDLKAQKKDKKKYYNKETLLGDKVKDIDDEYFYTTNNFAFDIRELKQVEKNPYTNCPFSSKEEKQINRILDNLESNNISTDIDNEIPFESMYTSSLANVFSKLEQSGTYSNLEVFKNFNAKELLIFIKFLKQCPIIFENMDYNNFRHIRELYYDGPNEQFKYSIIKFLEYLLDSNPINQDIIALVISEAIRPDIIGAYNNKEYLNYCR